MKKLLKRYWSCGPCRLRYRPASVLREFTVTHDLSSLAYRIGNCLANPLAFKLLLLCVPMIFRLRGAQTIKEVTINIQNAQNAVTNANNDAKNVNNRIGATRKYSVGY